MKSPAAKAAAVERTRLWRIANPEKYAIQKEKHRLNNLKNAKALYLKYGKGYLLREKENLEDSYIVRILRNKGIDRPTQQQIAEHRAKMLAKREKLALRDSLKADGYAVFYTLSGLPCERGLLPYPTELLRVRVRGGIKKCVGCKVCLPVEAFGERVTSIGKAVPRSSCRDCECIAAKIDARVQSEALSDRYVRQRCRSTGLDDSASNIRLKRAVINFKRTKKEMSK